LWKQTPDAHSLPSTHSAPKALAVVTSALPLAAGDGTLASVATADEREQPIRPTRMKLASRGRRMTHGG